MLPLLIVFGGVVYSGIKALQQHRAETQTDTPPPPPASAAPLATLPEDRDQSAAMQLMDEPEADHYLQMTALAVGASVATWVYPPAGLVAVSLLTYLGGPMYKSTAIATFVEVKPRACQVETVVYVAALASGYYVMASLCSAVYFSSYKLLAKTQSRSMRRVQSLFNDNPRHVWLSYDDVEVEVPFDSLQPGDVIVLHAGEFVPIDGTVVRGVATVDQRALTGESMPVEKAEGDSMLASTSLLSGKVYVRVDKTGAATTAANIQRVLNNTANYTDAVEQEAGRFSNRMAGPALLAGGATALLLGPMQGIAMIGCDQSELTRVSNPLGMLNYLDMSAQRGVLIKDGRCLEILRGVDTVVFDKTGTLTLDQPHVGYIHCFGDWTENEVLRLAAAAEAKQSHPIAAAIRAAAAERNLTLPALDDACYEIGYGLKVDIEGHWVYVGSARYMRNQQIDMVDEAHLANVLKHCDHHGFSLVYVAHGQKLVGMLELHSSIRPEARTVVRQLLDRGLDLIIVSGDNEQPTRHLAEQIGIPHYYANVLPHEKAEVIQRLRSNGKSICFVGDGINDAVALKTANVGVSIHGASDAALDTANVILMDRTLSQLGTLFTFADEIARSRQHGYRITIATSAVGAVGVLCLGFGLPAALMLYLITGVATTGAAMLPRLTHRDPPSLTEPEQAA